uniref:Protein FAR1-RELATED SEQUENCE 5 n=1 Tax=Cajanus cajan TaxID=3821 RepID=A0A151SYL7_CAJCA|nr:Protein FAR1-RELATED SEQUENCE 5 [Cajanus cajan]
MEFCSEHDAYKFYFGYAKYHGFGVRKDEVGYDKNHNIVMRQFLCNKAGLRDKKHFIRDDRKKKHRPLTRTNCKAKLRVHLDEKIGKWKVVSFEASHNHIRCEDKYVSLIPTYRGLSTTDKAQVDLLHAQGVRTCHIMGFMMEQKGDNDAMFFSRYVVGEEGELKHLFWSDGTSRSDFQCFGDVVAFDSTYKKNKYNKPLVIFSGKNHHSQTVIFGCCVVSDETIETYKWVLETFLDAMCNKEPKSIVTDGDGAMWEAIKQVFPNATHRLCGWHLQKNACQNVKNSNFLADFKRAMYGNFSSSGNFSSTEFEKFWQELVVKHEVQDNNWVNEVYRKRGMWAHAYLRDKFFAGIRTTSLCEGINSCIKTYIRRKNTIVELLYNFEHSLRDFRYNELVSDYNSLYTEPVLTSSLRKIERQAANLFTRNIFKQVASEIITAGSLNVTNKFEVEDKVCFKVDKFCERDWEHNVGYDKEEGKFVCDCMMYEFCGIPCSHIICVMRYEHMECFPSSLICKRWLKDAKSSYMSSFESEVEDTDMMVMARFALLAACCNSLCSIAAKKCDSFNFVRNEVLKLKEQLDKKLQLNENIEKNDSCDPNVVKTKGAPVTKKKKKNSRKCSNCKKSGHFITCPAVVSQQHDVSEINGVCGSESASITSARHKVKLFCWI